MSRAREILDRPAVREWLLGGAHLTALFAFAFVQPLLDLLGRSPDFWVARANTAGDIVIFAVGFTVLPPLALMAIEGLVALVNRRAYRALHLALVALLVAVIAVQVEKRIFSEPAGLMIVIALLLGLLAAWALVRTRFARALLDVLTVAPLVFLAIFFFFSDSSELILPQSEANPLGERVPSRTPVVMVILDELPTASLMNPRGKIDARRFPNFAELARSSTWYRNNTTVADFTGRAVPAIMTGNDPGFTTLPIASDQPNSIFTLLGDAYHMHVKEAVTSVCPSDVCGEVIRPPQLERLGNLVDDLRYVEGRLILPPAIANDLPNVSATFGNFGHNDGGGETGGDFAKDLFIPPTPGEFEHYLDRIPADGSTLSLIHMELPHEPFHFLPDGRIYEETTVSDLNSPSAASWAVGPAGIASVYQRHLLQTGYADRLMGRMIARLREIGIWKRALVVVTADHGISFRPRIFRRIALPENLGGVANPPLFIKYPGQTKGKVSDIHTRTIDILPTIAQVLGIDLPYRTQGRPISEGGARPRLRISNGEKTVVIAPLSTVVRDRREAIEWGRRYVGNAGLYALGPRSDLIGFAPPALSTGIPPGLGVTVENTSFFEDVDPEAESAVPAFVAGATSGVPAGALLAISLNGEVVATTRVFIDEGEDKYGVIVPPSAFIAGRNSIGVYLISGDDLIPLGGN